MFRSPSIAFACSLAVIAEATPQFSTDDKCCATCPEGQQRFYSVDMKYGHCSEWCFGPPSTDLGWLLYKIFFEKNLTIADGSTGFKSCAELGWPKYSETVSHGSPTSGFITCDLYDRDDASNVEEQNTASIVDLAEATTQFSTDDMCCATCPGGQQKYYSVDMKHGHCGETCIKPSSFGLYKVFEKNLTIADGSTGFKSCAELGWPKYSETVSHGDPLKLLVATLDLYDRDAVEVLV
jgi:hypothetical protein